MNYAKSLTFTACTAVSTFAQCGIVALDAGVTARRYWDSAYAHYDALFLGEAAVERYETLGYYIGTALGIAAVILLEGVDALQTWVDKTVEDAQAIEVSEGDPGDCTPEPLVDIPVKVVFTCLLKSLVYDIYRLFKFLGDISHILKAYGTHGIIQL